MPPQHVEIAETVAALRRKLRREQAAADTEPTQFATNRGNKLRPGARYVHSGALPYKSRDGYREEINHAGHHRYILGRNPRRYDTSGDELADGESDSDADSDAVEENAYGDIRIEELLRPLTHPSELATHPSFVHAYTDTALPDMVLATDAKIREERNNLWKAKSLYRYFTGDESWIPGERVDAMSDWDLFGPSPGFTGTGNSRLANGQSPSKKRRLSSEVDGDGDVQIADAIDDAFRTAATDAVDETLAGLPQATKEAAVAEGGDIEQEVKKDEDIDMDDHVEKAQANGAYPIRGSEDDVVPADESVKSADGEEVEEDEPATDLPDVSPTLNGEAGSDDQLTHIGGDNNENDDDRPSTASTPPPPPRRITRALAAEADTNSNPQIASPPPTSPTLSSAPPSPSAFDPHPMFLLPSHLVTMHTAHPSYASLSISLAHSGLPPEELLETRKLLSLYIQKSEETIRGLEGILGKLIKAKRRRDKVFEWSKAEGHIGEMSDGEDWIDSDAWGLQRSELRKGRDEDSGAAEGGNLPVGTEGNEEQPAGVQIGGKKGRRGGRRVAGV